MVAVGRWGWDVVGLGGFLTVVTVTLYTMTYDSGSSGGRSAIVPTRRITNVCGKALSLSMLKGSRKASSDRIGVATRRKKAIRILLINNTNRKVVSLPSVTVPKVGIRASSGIACVLPRDTISMAINSMGCAKDLRKAVGSRGTSLVFALGPKTVPVTVATAFMNAG